MTGGDSRFLPVLSGSCSLSAECDRMRVAGAEAGTVETQGKPTSLGESAQRMAQKPGPKKTAFRKKRCIAGYMALKFGSAVNAITWPWPTF